MSRFPTRLQLVGDGGANGIREIIAGTGGENHSISSKLYPGTEASDGGHFGILEMTLHPAGYDWQFVSDKGSVIDSGSDTCVTSGHAPPGLDDLRRVLIHQQFLAYRGAISTVAEPMCLPVVGLRYARK